jgi:hypothetical protein
MAASEDLLKARRESAELMGLNYDRLSPADVLRCDLISTLRLVIDDAGGTVLEGGSTDLAKLITATESLIRLLPGHELPEPAPVDGGPGDPRVHMWNTYKQMRDRGADVGQGYDGLKLTVEKLQAELAVKDARIGELEASLAGSVPLPPNAVKLSLRNDKSPPAAAAPAPAARPFVNGTSDLVARYSVPDEPWREHLNRHYDPWADNRR